MNKLEKKAEEILELYIMDEIDYIETSDDLHQVIHEIIDSELIRLDCSGEAYEIARYVEHHDSGLYEGETDIDRIILTICYDGLQQEVWRLINERELFKELM